MLRVIHDVLYNISIAFAILYVYHIIYHIIPIFKRNELPKQTCKNYRYAILIAARNEENVLPFLLESLKDQSYDSNLYDIFVVADNCTDKTAQVAREGGAISYERFNKDEVGKGYALNFLFQNIFEAKGYEYYDAYLIFDADNLVDSNFLTEMNRVYNQGYDVITSYRNSKNYGDNWISAAYGLNFIRESIFLNASRMHLKSACFISGTGFLVSKEIIKENNGWPYHLLTEDIQLTTDQVLKNRKIGYAAKAMLYDEQPTSFIQSYHQRLRWCKGFIQVFYQYGLELFLSLFKKNRNFSKFDMFMTLLPTMISIFILPALGITSLILLPMNTILKRLIYAYLSTVVLALLVVVSANKSIQATLAKKIIHCFTYPIFMSTYIFISIIAMFKDVTWKPIQHAHTTSIYDYREEV